MATCNDLSVTGRACLTMINSEWAKFTKQLTVKSTFSHFQITITVGWTFFHLEIDFELNRWILIEAKDKLNYLLAKKSHWNVTIIYCLACTVSLKNHKVTNVSNFITFDTLTVTSSAKCAKHSCDTHQFLHLSKWLETATTTKNRTYFALSVIMPVFVHVVSWKKMVFWGVGFFSPSKISSKYRIELAFDSDLSSVTNVGGL